MPDEIVLGTPVTTDSPVEFTPEQVKAGFCLQRVATVEGAVVIVAAPEDGSARETGKVALVDGEFQLIESV